MRRTRAGAPALHRLSRTEYRNAVRDLLALDDLPKEFDVSTLLPADNVTSGFDNLAELLFVSRRRPWSGTWPRRAGSAGSPSAIRACRRSSTAISSTAT